jgi:hypothetical protein
MFLLESLTKDALLAVEEAVADGKVLARRGPLRPPAPRPRP